MLRDNITLEIIQFLEHCEGMFKQLILKMSWVDEMLASLRILT